MWDYNYELAKEYYECHGDLNIPKDYIINGVKLGIWLSNIKIKYSLGKLSKEQINKLESIGIIWNKRENNWEEKYNILKKYYEEYGNINLVLDTSINRWLAHQKESYKLGKLSPERIAKLNSLGIIWFYQKDSWEQMYQAACNYYKKNNNLVVPIDYEEDGIKLGSWIHDQRNSYGNLSPERINKLNSIGMIWNVLTYMWEVYYHLATKYYESYGNLHIHRKFKTKDGVTYDEEGLPLGVWLNTQRYNYQKGILSTDRITKLSNIGMIWDIRLNQKEVKDLCLEYHINYELNKDILKRIAIKELILKINYLQSINENIIDNHGHLNKIFKMSNKDIINEYGIDLYQRGINCEMGRDI